MTRRLNRNDRSRDLRIEASWRQFALDLLKGARRSVTNCGSSSLHSRKREGRFRGGLDESYANRTPLSVSVDHDPTIRHTTIEEEKLCVFRKMRETIPPMFDIFSPLKKKNKCRSHCSRYVAYDFLSANWIETAQWNSQHVCKPYDFITCIIFLQDNKKSSCISCTRFAFARYTYRYAYS